MDSVSATSQARCARLEIFVDTTKFRRGAFELLAKRYFDICRLAPRNTQLEPQRPGTRFVLRPGGLESVQALLAVTGIPSAVTLSGNFVRLPQFVSLRR